MSGRKNFLNSFKITTAGDMSQATVTSAVTNIQGEDNIGIQVNILTGTATGTLDVQISNDYLAVNGSVKNAGNWISLGSSYQVTVTSGQPANIYWDINQMSAMSIRLLWTRSSGTGTYDAIITGKMI